MAYFSNGTEGEIWENKYCARCLNYSEDAGGCTILDVHMEWAYELCNSREAGKKILDTLIPMEGLFAGRCSMLRCGHSVGKL